MTSDPAPPCLKAPAAAPRLLASQAGVTLLEMLIATVILGLVVTGITLAFSNFQQALARRDSVSDANLQLSQMTDLITKYWTHRAHPMPTNTVLFPSFNAAWPGFKTPSNRLGIFYLSSNGAQGATIATGCVAIPSSSPLYKLSFANTSTCQPCQRGRRQQVTIRTTSGQAAVYPAGTVLSRQTVLSMSACFQPWTWPEPLSLDIQAGTMDPSGKVAVITKTLDLPIDNFSGLNINQ